MTIEQAIKDAIKGGWELADRSVIVPVNSIGRVFVVGGDIFLDPLFWQALGKTRGWDGYTREKYIHCPDCGEESIIRNPAYCKERNMPDGYNYEYCKEHQNGLTIWKKKWHSFIDHLATQRPINEFFENLE